MFIYVIEPGSGLRSMTFTRYTVVKENKNSYDVENGQVCLTGVWEGNLRRVHKTRYVYTDKALAYTNAALELTRQIQVLTIEAAEKTKILRDAVSILEDMST